MHRLDTSKRKSEFEEWLHIMKPSKKLWLVMLVGVCVVLVQYHLVSTWLVEGPSAGGLTFAAEPGVGINSVSNDELLRTAASRLHIDRAVSASLGQKFLQELVIQLGHQLLSIGLCGEAAMLTASQGRSMQVVASGAGSHSPKDTNNAAIVPAPSLDSTVPALYIITPTYRRPEQIPELTRLAQTLMHVDNLHWIVIEDATTKSQLVSDLLERTGISYVHLVAPMPEAFRKKRGPKPRGVSNRNRGLEWLRANATTGVFYFADDDNTYDIQLFEEMRTTKRVSMWPVGLCTKFGVSSPVVVNGTFTGFYDGWVAGRKFPVDMAGFAVSVKFLKQRPKASMPYKPGFEEDGFLKSLAPFEPKEIELKAKNCTQVLVWHTQTKKNEASAPLDISKYNNTNLVLLKKLIV